MSGPAIREEFPRDVREIENTFIELTDGCRLAARIWLPEDASSKPVPAIFELIPYRKRDFTRSRDDPMHAYFAGHGYAAVRVDVRGSGDSGGMLTDEYTQAEWEDAVEVIAWIASQPWCTGRVGMMGISWGGFNALQVAAMRPPELGAVITMCASDDRYADDAHYMGGCLLNENLTWGAVLTLFSALPPDPELAGDGWREAWHARLRNAKLFPSHWLAHQRRDAYWRHGSVCEDFAKIQCPVYAIGGWADGYSNAIPRLVAGLESPVKGLIGPWAHVFPHDGTPGPRIGFLQEALRWWDHWLKDVDTGIVTEPQLRVWMQESEPPHPTCEARAGRWVAEDSWPSPHIEPRTWHLNPRRLDADPAEEELLDISSPNTVGLGGGDWCGFGSEGEMPIDQRADDGKSLVFDSEVLPERMEILGAPEVRIDFCSDQPIAQLAVRINDVAPDGTSARVTYGLLNLTHRDSHEHPAPLEVADGRSPRYSVTVRLNDVAHAFPAGHVLRVALSTGYWPIAWPAPRSARLSVFSGASTLTLPVRPPRAEDARLPPFEAPEHGPPVAHTLLHPAKFRRIIERDLTTNDTIYTIQAEGGEFEGASIARVDAIDLEVGTWSMRRYRINDTDPLSAQAEVTMKALLRRRGWSVKIDVRARMRATVDHFIVEGDLEAHEGDAVAFQHHFEDRIPRDHV